MTINNVSLFSLLISLGSLLTVTDVSTTPILNNDTIKNHNVSKMMNAKDNEGNTPMHVGIMRCTSKIDDRMSKTLITLLELGANPFMENNNSNTPRQEALLRGCESTAELLELFEKAYHKTYFDSESK